MGQVIRIGEEPKEEKVLRPIELTHFVNSTQGWVESDGVITQKITRLVYLGADQSWGDIFAAYYSFPTIIIFKGHLNDGVY